MYFGKGIESGNRKSGLYKFPNMFGNYIEICQIDHLIKPSIAFIDECYRNWTMPIAITKNVHAHSSILVVVHNYCIATLVRWFHSNLVGKVSEGLSFP